MKTFNVSQAKAEFSGIVRKVIKNRETVIMTTPSGCVQIVPFDVPDFVPPAEKGSLQLTEQEIKFANGLGDTL